MSGQKTARAYVGLGGNIGDRLTTLRSALRRLHEHPALTVVRASPVLETSPVGPSITPFLNAAAELHCTTTATETLAILHEVERAHGRTRRVRWEARTLDLDLLLFFEPGATEPLSCDHAGLTLPHPRIAERDFVLEPLAALIPAVRVEGVSIEDRLAALSAETRTVRRSLAEALVDPDPEGSTRV